MKQRLWPLLLLLACQPLSAQNVPLEYKAFFFKYEENSSLIERGLNLIGLSNRDVGHSIALVAGVWNYPRATSFPKTLEPARVDLDRLNRYLRDYEFFHEIIVLENDNVTFETLNYFLNVYIPSRVNRPKSRFLFAYSGHGMQDGPGNGYILTSKATTLNDRPNAINLRHVKTLVDESVKAAHHTLVMINSCFSGDLIPVAQGDYPLIPKESGAHVITAGSAGQLTYGHQEDKGSDFFDLVLAGLDRRADTSPTYEIKGEILRGDGIITTEEMFSYLQGEFRRKKLDEKQMPQKGDIAQLQSLGSFYFVRRGVNVENGAITGKVGSAAAFGNDESGDPNTKGPTPKEISSVYVEHDVVEDPHHHIDSQFQGAFFKGGELARLNIKRYEGIGTTDSLIIVGEGKRLGMLENENIELLAVCHLKDGRDAFILHEWRGGATETGYHTAGSYSASSNRFEFSELGYGDSDLTDMSKYVDCTGSQPVEMPEGEWFYPCVCTFEEQLVLRSKALELYDVIAPASQEGWSLSDYSESELTKPLPVRNLSLSIAEIKNRVEGVGKFEEIGRWDTWEAVFIRYYDSVLGFDILVVQDHSTGKTYSLLDGGSYYFSNVHVENGKLIFEADYPRNITNYMLSFTIDLPTMQITEVIEVERQ